MIAKDDWEHFCIVGLGKHAKSKLIPALLANGQKVAGLVSSQDPKSLEHAPVFNNIATALSVLPSDTVFIIATPPSMHFEQVIEVLSAGHDVIVEKPAFLTANNARAVAVLCEQQELVVVEGLMHRYTKLYRRLIDYWYDNSSPVEKLSVVFLIPEMPQGTFRQRREIASSCLYDMGCYAISLLADLGLPLNGLRIMNVSSSRKGQKEIAIGGKIGGVDVSIRIGEASTYQNFVHVSRRNGETANFSPFFYGRQGDKWISLKSNGTTRTELLADVDAFRAMFMIPRAQWLDNQDKRFAKMLEVTDGLEMLGHKLSLRRN